MHELKIYADVSEDRFRQTFRIKLIYIIYHFMATQRLSKLTKTAYNVDVEQVFNDEHLDFKRKLEVMTLLEMNLKNFEFIILEKV